MDRGHLAGLLRQLKQVHQGDSTRIEDRVLAEFDSLRADSLALAQVGAVLNGGVAIDSEGVMAPKAIHPFTEQIRELARSERCAREIAETLRNDLELTKVKAATADNQLLHFREQLKDRDSRLAQYEGQVPGFNERYLARGKTIKHIESRLARQYRVSRRLRASLRDVQQQVKALETKSLVMAIEKMRTEKKQDDGHIMQLRGNAADWHTEVTWGPGEIVFTPEQVKNIEKIVEDQRRLSKVWLEGSEWTRIEYLCRAIVKAELAKVNK